MQNDTTTEIVSKTTDGKTALEEIRKQIENLSTNYLNEQATLDHVVSGNRMKCLTVTNLRRFYGKNEVNLDRPFTLIYAPNGVGKSTLTDALFLAHSGVTPRSLNEKSQVDKSEVADKKNLVSAGRKLKPEAIEIGIQFEEGSFEYKHQETTNNPPADKYVVISRATIRNSIAMKATDRFDTIYDLVNLGQFDQAYNELDNSLQEEIKRIDELVRKRKSLEDNLKANGADLNTISVRDILTPDKAEAEVKSKREQLKEFAREKDKLSDSLRTLQEMPSFAAPPVSPKPPADTTSVAVSLNDHLEKILHALKPGERCPVCGQSTITQDTIDDLKKTLDRSVTWKNYTEERDKYSEQFSRWFDNTKAELGELRKIALASGSETFDEFSGFLTKRQDELESITTADFDLKRATEFQNVLKLNLKSQQDEINASIEILTSDIDKLNFTNLERVRQILGNFGNSVEQISQVVAEIRESENAKRSAQGLRNELRSIQKQVMAEYLKPIENEVTQWFKILTSADLDFDLHMDFGSGKNPAIKLKCVITGENNKTEHRDAFGFLSDSQLDLLSLAFTFAGLSKKIGDGAVWLDDPTDMLDEAGMERFCKDAIPKLIKQGNQVILCTHSRSVVNQIWDAFPMIIEAGTLAGWERPSATEFVLSTRDDYDDGPAVATFLPVSLRAEFDALDKTMSRITGGNQRLRWKVGTRLHLANSIRRAAEFLFAELFDALTLIDTPPYQGRQVPSISNNKKTLGSYAKDAQTRLESILKEVQKLPESGPKTGALQQVRKVLETISEFDYGVLNEGSHGSMLVPTFDELTTQWAAMKKIRNLLEPTDSSFPTYRIKNLKIPS